ncbi:MAG: hypothetical protein ACT4TC_07695 [Myxococcaceae bacterium]
MGKPRMSFVWMRETWSEQTADLIERWGEALGGILYELYERDRPRRKVVAQRLSTLKTLVALTTHDALRAMDPAIFPDPQTKWAWFRDDVMTAAGISVGSTADLALHLSERFGWYDLALELVGVHEALHPTDRQPAEPSPGSPEISAF